MRKFDLEERLPISAIKQYVYCKRRFALMFVDREWESNYKIIEGDFLHEKVDDPFFNEKRGDLHISRSIPVFSERLNLYGVADLVEFTKSDSGVPVKTKEGLWNINPIDYKNGKPEKSNADACQLCAVAMCLEEMFKTTIPKGDLYYGKLRRRVEVSFTNEIREMTFDAIESAHGILENRTIPQKPKDQNCSLCSLINICMPMIFDRKHKNKSDILKLVKEG